MSQLSDLTKHAESNIIIQISASALKQYLDEDRERTYGDGYRCGMKMAKTTNERLLNVGEAAEALGVCRRTIERLRSRGDLESVDIDGMVRFEPGEISRYKRTHSSLAASLKQ